MIQSNKCTQVLLSLCFLKLKILAFHHAVHMSHSNQVRLKESS